MDVKVLAVHWHNENLPVYSVHFQPNRQGVASERLVTGGGDNNVRIWRVSYSQAPGEEDAGPQIDYLCTLSKHTGAINVVRFDPQGRVLATAGDDGIVFFWTLGNAGSAREFGADPDDEVKESWVLRHASKSGSAEIYDLAWSPDSKYVITGSTDNIARIYEAHTGLQVAQIAEHNHIIQGVCWDPCSRYVATQSADRSVHIYALGLDEHPKPTIYHKISRTELPARPSAPVSDDSLPAVRAQPARLNFGLLKSSMLYHSENYEAFFRRLAFSPDGNFLLTPAGIFKNHQGPGDGSGPPKEELVNTVYIYSRGGLNRAPLAHLPGFKKPAVAVSFSPVYYALDTGSAGSADSANSTDTANSTVFKLPYKMVYAVLTQDSVVIFDTQHEQCLGTVSNIHFSTLTDLAWNCDGSSIIVSSYDGFCSSIRFADGELGQKLPGKPACAATDATQRPSGQERERKEATLLDYLNKNVKAPAEPVVHQPAVKRKKVGQPAATGPARS